jgi:hypothetical protein
VANAGAARDEIVLMGAVAVFLLLPLAAAAAHLAYAPAIFILGCLAAFRRQNWALLPEVLIAGARKRSSAAVAGWSAILFCVWISASGVWSPQHKYLLGAHVFAMAFFGLAFGVEATRFGGRALKIMTAAVLSSSAAALALLLSEGLTHGAIRAAVPPPDISGGKDDIVDLARGLTAAIPGLVAGGALFFQTAPVSRRRAAATALILAFVAAIWAAMLHDVSSNVFSLAAGAAAGIAAYKAPKTTLRAMAAIALVSLLAAPFAASLLAPDDAIGRLPASWVQRLYIWRGAADEIFACLPFGCGADYARSISDLKEMVNFPGAPTALPVMPIHPHNLFLEIWLELGLPGVVLAAAVVASSTKVLLRADLSRAAAAGTGAVAGAALAPFYVEASLWQDWRIAAIAIGAGVVALTAARSKAAP